MSRSNRHKEKLEIKSEIRPDNDNEETAARTRPVSYDEIMHRRKNKKQSAELVAKPVDAGNLSGEFSIEKVPNRSQSSRGYRSTKLSSIIVAKQSSEDSEKVKSRINEDNLSKDRIMRKLGKDSHDRVIRSKPTMNRDVSDKVGRSMDDRHDQWRRSHGNSGNEYERRHSRHLVERDIYADTSRGRTVANFDRKPRNDNEERKSEREPVKVFDRKPRNGDEERKSGREIKRKQRNDDEERRMQQNALKKLDSGRRHDHEAPERKDPVHKERKGSLQFHNEGSKSKKKRSRSRERDKDKGRRSASLSPRSHRHISNNVQEHGDTSLNSSKDRFRREQDDDERNRISNNGSSGRYRRPGGNPSGLGGYSPRKRRTEAAVKTPSPPHQSPEKKSAGWDLPPPGPNTNSTVSILPNLQSLSHTVISNTHELLSMAPVTSTPVKAIQGIFSFASVDSVQLTQATRPMRRLYVENLPDLASEKTVMECLNNFLLSSGVNRVPGSQPCISCSIHKEKGQALVEFLTPEDASAALCFDGRYFSGSALKIRRPRDYIHVPTGVADKSVAALDSSRNIVRDSPNKIFIGGIPKIISSEMLREIAAVFGPLKAFHFEVNVDLDGPCAFLEYADQSVTLKACAGLNAMRLGGQMLTVVQATPDASSVENSGNPPFYGIPEHAKPLLEKPTQVLKLKNVLIPDRLSSLSEQELEEILEDVRLECARFGIVNSVNVVKCRDGDSKPETCQAPDDTGSANDRDMDSFEDMNSEHHGEHIDGETQETSLLEVPCDNPKQNEDHKSLEYEVTSNKEDTAYNAASHDNSETVVKGLACESNPSFTSLELDHQPLDRNGDKIDENIMTTYVKVETVVKGLAYGNNPSFTSPELDHQSLDRNGDKVNENIMTTDVKIETEVMVDENLKTMLTSLEAVSGAVDSSEAEKDENMEAVFKLEDSFETGSILVEYKRIEASSVAAHYLHGRLFDDRIVTVEYVGYDIYKAKFLK